MLLNILTDATNIYLFIGACIGVVLILWGLIALAFLVIVGVGDDGPIVDESEDIL